VNEQQIIKEKENKIEIDNLTVKEIKHIQSVLKTESGEVSPYHIGKNYFIRTVTHYLTGKLVQVTSKELVIEQAAWIADSGRFMQFLAEGKLNEVEPFPQELEVIVGRGAIIDAVIWKHELPKSQK
jgi:hypothetical protein